MSRQIGEVPTRTFEPGTVIFREGDDAKGEAFMVHQGRVEIRKQIGGEERLLGTLAKGELLGLGSLIGISLGGALEKAANFRARPQKWW